MLGARARLLLHMLSTAASVTTDNFDIVWLLAVAY
jgi:hypothetical protein